jgi:hypothetical protein
MTTTESDQLEAESELHRARVAGILDELRARLSPGEIVDQVLGSVRDGAAQDFARNLGTQVRNNPLPCVLIGAGMAWLMLGGRNGPPHRAVSVRRTTELQDVHGETAAFAHDVRANAGGIAQRASASVTDAAERAAQAARRARSVTTGQIETATTTMSDVADTASQTYEQTRDAAARTYEDTRDSAARTYEQTRDAAARTYEQTRDTATQTYQQARGRIARALQGVTEMVSNTVGQARGTVDRSMDQLSGAASAATSVSTDAARQATSRVARLAQEQPLVLAGIGIAIGAALAAMFPVTEAENRLVGRTSDELKDRARGLANEGVEKVQSVATAAVETATTAVTEAAQQEASRQGLTFGGEHGTAYPQEPGEHDDDTKGATHGNPSQASDGRGEESRDTPDVRR